MRLCASTPSEHRGLNVALMSHNTVLERPDGISLPYKSKLQKRRGKNVFEGQKCFVTKKSLEEPQVSLECEVSSLNTLQAIKGRRDSCNFLRGRLYRPPNCLERPSGALIPRLFSTFISLASTQNQAFEIK